MSMAKAFDKLWSEILPLPGENKVSNHDDINHPSHYELAPGIEA